MNPIETFNLSKKFGNKVVLNNISMSIAEKELFGFLGRNGAGKSTFINVLTGNVNKTEGSFNLLGYIDKDINTAKKEIGVMPDVANLYGDMTAVQFLRYMSNLKNIKNNSTDAHRLLKMVGLEVLDTMKIKNYSFGMKKKISLAQALIGEPRLLFLDEPTSGVDPESIINIQKLIVDLNKKGTTIFLTSHNLNEIEKICTSIAILKGGHIDLCGSITDIRKSFCKNITVTIKADIPSDISDVSEFVVTKMVNSNKNVFTFEVDSEEEIAYIITQIVNNKGSIYSVTQNSITLEEIFLK